MRFSTRLLCVLTVAVLAFPAQAFALVPAMRRIDSVSFSDANNGWIAGGEYAGDVRNGFVSVTHDGGETWQATLFPGKWMVAVRSLDSASALAVSSSDDHVNRTTDGGANWTALGPVLNAAGANFRSSAQFANATVAVGQRRWTSRGDLAVIATSSAGTDWSTAYQGPYYPAVDEESDPPNTMASMSAVDTTGSGMVGWAVGTEWNPPSGGDGSTATRRRQLAFKTTDGGSTWATQTISGTPRGSITSLAMVDSNVAFAGTDGPDFYRTANGGVTWSAAMVNGVGYFFNGGTIIKAVPIAVDAWDGNHLVIAGTSGTTGSSGTTGWIFRTDNFASASPTWSAQLVSPTQRFTGISVVSPMHWIATGPEETMWTTKDAGATWSGFSGSSAPVLSMTSPTAGFTPSGSISIEGTASDIGVGVAKVAVRIARADGAFWNGSNWVASETWIPAGTADAFKHWSYTWNAADTGGMKVTVSAKVTDGMMFTDSESVISTGSLATTALSVTPSSQTINYAAKGSITGTLTSGGTPISNQKVVLWGGSSASTLKATSAYATTDANGRYTFTPGPTSLAYYKAVYSATSTRQGSSSSVVSVRPRAQVGTPSTPSTVKRYRAFTVYGALRPKHSTGSYAVRVYFERYDTVAKKWVTKKTVNAKLSNPTGASYSKYSVSTTLPYTGKWRARAYHGDTGHAASYSSYRYLTAAP